MSCARAAARRSTTAIWWTWAMPTGTSSAWPAATAAFSCTTLATCATRSSTVSWTTIGCLGWSAPPAVMPYCRRSWWCGPYPTMYSICPASCATPAVCRSRRANSSCCGTASSSAIATIWRRRYFWRLQPHSTAGLLGWTRRICCGHGTDGAALSDRVPY